MKPAAALARVYWVRTLGEGSGLSEFEDFYGGTQSRVLRAVLAVTGDPDDAQDCVQEAYVRAAMRWKRVSAHDSPEAWVRRVAMNLAFDGHRRRRVRQLAFGRQRGPEPAAAPGDAALDVVWAVRLLPRAQQEVVVLHHLLDLSVEAVARELGRPPNTVKTQLARARVRLAQLLTVADEVATHD
jgi:RNA polymerase sigma-70 factor (ECF subfamily)